jgi:hypothetical protein
MTTYKPFLNICIINASLKSLREVNCKGCKHVKEMQDSSITLNSMMIFDRQQL